MAIEILAMKQQVSLWAPSFNRPYMEKGREIPRGKLASSITELENKISWRVEDSDIASINDNAGSEWVEIDPSTTERLALCLQVAEQTLAVHMIPPFCQFPACGILTARIRRFLPQTIWKPTFHT